MLHRLSDSTTCVYSDPWERHFSEFVALIRSSKQYFLLPSSFVRFWALCSLPVVFGAKALLVPRGGLRGSAGGPMRDRRDLAYATAFSVARGEQR
jgi:hypothetical protein